MAKFPTIATHKVMPLAKDTRPRRLTKKSVKNIRDLVFSGNQSGAFRVLSDVFLFLQIELHIALKHEWKTSLSKIAVVVFIYPLFRINQFLTVIGNQRNNVVQRFNNC